MDSTTKELPTYGRNLEVNRKVSAIQHILYLRHDWSAGGILRQAGVIGSPTGVREGTLISTGWPLGSTLQSLELTNMDHIFELTLEFSPSLYPRMLIRSLPIQGTAPASSDTVLKQAKLISHDYRLRADRS